MRIPSYISPTSLFQWESDREQFYIDRLADTRSPRGGQSPAASVGSGFDAFVKCALYKSIYGNDGGGVYDLERLFKEQVEGEENQAFAWRAGQECFRRYVKCGAYAELLVELTSSTKEPQFEFSLRGEVEGVPLQGKPDLYYYRDVHVMYDWKVMGFCSRHAQSPKKLHRSCRDTWKPTEFIKATRGGGQSKPHKKYEEMEFHGHKIGTHWMEETDSKWADQLCIYGWLKGVPVGSEDYVVGIDQLACKPAPKDKEGKCLCEYPLIRVAQHRCRISQFHQLELMRRLKDMHAAILSGYIFDDLTREENDQKIEALDLMTAAVDTDEDRAEIWDMCGEKEYRG
jgi:hypothetical protein